MNLPSTRIGFARIIAHQIAAEARRDAGTIAADAVRLIRDHRCSPSFASRNAIARARAMNQETARAYS